MKPVCFLFLFAVVTVALSGCYKKKNNSVSEYGDKIARSHHWIGHIARSGYSYSCCKDTFSRKITDTTILMTKPSDNAIKVGNYVQLRYRSTDDVAHTVKYDTVLYAGTVSPLGYYLTYYYLLDSSVFSYSGKTLSDCGADFFYQIDGAFTTSN